MNYSTYRITLDVRNTVSNVQLTAKKGDAGRKVYITLSDKGKPCEIADGSYAVFAGVKPDGKLLYNKTTIENNTIIYEMTQQTTAVAGLVACEVKLFDSMSNLLTSPKLTIWVDDVVVPDEEIVSKDEVTAFAELVFEANKVIDLGNQTIAAGNAATEATIAATTAATEATQNANAATTEANTATDSANNAAASANAAASNATQETYSANIAATNANNAASDAREATEETNTARENIQQTASEVLTSLSNAVFAPPIESSASGAVVAVNDASNYLLRGLTIYGKTTQDGTPTPDNPVPLESAGDSGSIGVTVAMQNLTPYPYYRASGYAQNGITYTVNDDDSITANGTATGTSYFALCISSNPVYFPPGTYSMGGVPDGSFGGDLPLQFWFSSASDGNRFGVTPGGRTFTLDVGTYYGISVCVPVGNTVDNVTFYPMLTVGKTVLPFKSPNNPQTLTVSTPNGLAGIPVSSGGNYTDENGQQRICDVIDAASGEHHERIGKLIMDGTNVKFNDRSGSTQTNMFFVYVDDIDLPDYSESKTYPILCSHGTSISHSAAYRGTVGVAAYKSTTATSLRFSFGLTAEIDTTDKANEWLKSQYNNGTPLTFLYVLSEPIETPLSAEELAAYAALHTNKPNTTVYNDAGADMKLEYVADTKTFFTQQISAICAAMLNT